LISAFVNIRFALVFSLAVFALQSCNISKQIKNKDLLLKSNHIVIEERKESRFYKSDLFDYIKQKPNKITLGLFKLKLGFYLMGSGKNDNGIKRFLRYKLGEPPVLVDSFLIESSIKSMLNYLKTQGYYYPQLSYTVKVNKLNTKATINYYIKLNNAYHIYHIDQHVADAVIDSILSDNNEETYLKHGNRLKLENLHNEQARITNVLKNNGYFAFRKEEVNFDIDTTEGLFRVGIAANISNPYHFNYHKQYKIKSVFVDINDKDDTTQNYLNFKSFYFKSETYKLNPTVIENALIIQNNDLFNQRNVTRSYNRLNDLQLFRVVSFTTDVNDVTDTPEITYNIKLQSHKRFDFSIEPQAITTDQANVISGATFRNYGLATVLQLLHRNVFNNGELLQWRFRTSFEAQRGPNIPDRPFLNSFENALTANLILPKFLFFQRYEKSINSVINRTIISASAIYEQNVDWIRYLLTTSLNYQVTRQLVSYRFTPVAISFVRTDFANAGLEQLSKNDPFLQSIFTNNLIFDTRFGLTYSNQSIKKNKNFVFFNGDAFEQTGNLINAISKAAGNSKSDTGYNTSFGVPMYQYVKTWDDNRYNKNLDVKKRIIYNKTAEYALP